MRRTTAHFSLILSMLIQLEYVRSIVQLYRGMIYLYCITSFPHFGRDKADFFSLF